MNKLMTLALINSISWVPLAGCKAVDSPKSTVAIPQSFVNAKQFDLADGFLVINLPPDTIELNTLDLEQIDDIPRDPLRMFRSERLFGFSIFTESLSPQSFYQFYIDSIPHLEKQKMIRELVSRLFQTGGDYFVCKSILLNEQFDGTGEDIALLEYLRDHIVEYGSNSHGIGEISYTNARGDNVSIFSVYRNHPPPDGGYNIFKFFGFYNNKMAFGGSIASDQVDCVGMENTRELLMKIFISANDQDVAK